MHCYPPFRSVEADVSSCGKVMVVHSLILSSQLSSLPAPSVSIRDSGVGPGFSSSGSAKDYRTS